MADLLSTRQGCRTRSARLPSRTLVAYFRQRGPVRILDSPGPVRRIEVLRESDTRGVILLLSHGDHRPRHRKEPAAP